MKRRKDEGQTRVETAESHHNRGASMLELVFPKPKVDPHDLVGMIVQISLDRYELGGPHMLIPPLRVASCSEDRYEDTDVPRIAFLGEPLGSFRGTDHEDARFSRIEAIEFHSASPALPASFLLDTDFVSFCRGINYFPPVVVWGTTLPASEVGHSTLSIGERFFYIGYGMLQVFREGIGFEVPWPEPDPWIEELKEFEQLLLARDHSNYRPGR